MLKNSSILEKNPIKEYITNFEQSIHDIKKKSINYLSNSNDKDFFDISFALKRLGESQIVFPKKNRKQKTLKEIKEISISIRKIDKKLKAHDLIEKEITKNKTTEGDQTKARNLEFLLKIKKQNLLAKANKIIFDFNSLQITPFDDKINSISLQKRIKKFNQKVNKLTKKIQKEIKTIGSNNFDDKGNSIFRNINKLENNVEKLQIILSISPNNRDQSENKSINQQVKNSEGIIKNLDKVQQLLQDINNTNLAIKFLKKGGSEQYLVDLANKINKDLQNKEKQFIDMNRHIQEIKKPNL